MTNVTEDMRRIFGAPRRWTEGNILLAENAFIKMAYVVTEDPCQIGCVGWHPYKDTQMWVEYIGPDQGKLWSDVDRASSA